MLQHLDTGCNHGSVKSKLQNGEILVTGNQWPIFLYTDFTPSSVNKVVKATRSGNAQIHGMTQVTKASISYVATQVCSLISIDSALATAQCN